MSETPTTEPSMAKLPCWVCGQVRRKYMTRHHTLKQRLTPEGEEVSQDVTLCRGCHQLVGLLPRRLFLPDAKRVADLLTLARQEAALPDARTVVQFMET